MGGTEASCNTITIEGGAIANWITGAAATADTCPFSCSTGYAKTGRACNIPGLGKYADGSGNEQSCNNPTGAAGGFDVFLPNMGAVSTATGCGFSCNTGYVKDAPGRTCNFPSTGNYVNAQGTEVSCDSITSITTEGTATATWIAGAASAANTCPFSVVPVIWWIPLLGSVSIQHSDITPTLKVPKTPARTLRV